MAAVLGTMPDLEATARELKAIRVRLDVAITLWVPLVNDLDVDGVGNRDDVEAESHDPAQH